jgi:transcriptional regulator
MYTPQRFAGALPWPRLLANHAFGVLVSSEGDAFHATHLPYLASEAGDLVTMHMARANPHWRAIESHPRCRFIVQGAHGYVSPAWYETAAAVPTWNYEAVHLEGTAELEFDEAKLWEIVVALTGRFEEPGAAASWSVQKLTEDFRKPRLRSIVGVRLRVDGGEAKQKLSQDRSLSERRRIAAELRARGNLELAQAMDAIRPTEDENG